VETYDAIVIGGGPGGSTTASLLAMQGHKVLLLERDRFPRHQIGESLLPSTVHFIGQLLGIRDELQAQGYPRKLGACFRWGKSPDIWCFDFTSATALNKSDAGYAWQVERAKFDDLLLRNAQKKGVEVREEHTVTDAIVEGGRVVGVTYEDSSGKAGRALAKYVVDASGATGKIGQHVGERIYSTFFQNVAVYTYFENAKRMPSPREGNILCAAFKEGWFWYIPLSGSLTSVGAVVAKEHTAVMKGGDHEKAFAHFLDQCPLVKQFLEGATRVKDGMYTPVRIRKDYSYAHTHFWKPGIALVGDSACFVDPVLSTGVHLATYSALLTARSITSCLRHGIDEKRAFDEFEKRYRLEYNKIYDFMTAFYDMNIDEESYYWKARKILNSEEKANEAFVRLVAGVSSTDFNADELFNQRKGAGEALEKYMTEHPGADAREASAALARQGLTFEKSGGLGSGIHIDKQRTRAFEGGLIPSDDLMHWVDPDR
jgi:halogenation protein CepH